MGMLTVWIQGDQSVVDAILGVECMTEGRLRISPQSAYKILRELEKEGLIKKVGTRTEIRQGRIREREIYGAETNVKKQMKELHKTMRMIMRGRERKRSRIKRRIKHYLRVLKEDYWAAAAA